MGTSLTAGRGVEKSQAYPALIQEMLDSAGLDWVAVNAGVSGETSAGGLRRIDWLLRQRVSVLVLELGANDGLRGLNVDSMKANLARVIETTLERYPDAEVVIAGMRAPPNLGDAYTAAFSNVFRDLASEYDATLIPFLLQDVGGIADLNQADGIHPSPAGHLVVARTVWEYLEPLLVSASDDPNPEDDE